MKNIKSYSSFNENTQSTNHIELAEDMDSRLQGNKDWEKFVNDEFDKFDVNDWFDYFHEGGDMEKAIEYGESLIMKI